MKDVQTHNLGNGLLDMVKAFSKLNNMNVPYEIAPRRVGGVAACYADANRAKNELN